MDQTDNTYICPGCHEECDPEMCWCGDYRKGHSGYDGHPFVPMGCNCIRNATEAYMKRLEEKGEL